MAKEKSGVAALASRSDCRQIYGRLIESVTRFVFGTADSAKPAEFVAAAVERCLTRRRPPMRPLVAWEARVGVLANHIIPDRLFDFLLRATFGLANEPALEALEDDDPTLDMRLP